MRWLGPTLPPPRLCRCWVAAAPWGADVKHLGQCALPPSFFFSLCLVVLDELVDFVECGLEVRVLLDDAHLGPEAHRFLTATRDRHRDTQDDIVFHDLTDSPEFHWRAWVSQRPDAETIVGPGIVRFAFAWVAAVDDNLREKRGDFVISRADGVDIRLHPTGKKSRATGMKEAHPVWGSLDQWLPEHTAQFRHEALAASQGQAPRPPPAYRGISQADAVGGREARQFLEQEMTTWWQLPHPRGPFRADITSGTSASSQGQFHWPYYVQRRTWFREHFVSGDTTFSITKFELAWSEGHGHAVFVGCRSDGWSFTVNPWARNQAREFSWGSDNVSES